MKIEILDKLQRENDFLLWLALKHHKTHKNTHLNFDKFKYLKQLYLDKSKYITLKKSTQSGASEYLIIRAISKAIQGKSVFYVLPTFQLVGRVVKNRFNKSVAHTPYYKCLEQVLKQEGNNKDSHSMSLNHMGKGSIAYVGSNSTSGFAEYPADDVTIDELDECDQDNIIMAWERMSGSEDRTEIKVANPTVEGFGIDQEYTNSDQKVWKIKHHCGNYIQYDWFKQVVREVEENTYIIRDRSWDWQSGRDINIICEHCEKPVYRYKDGVWNPTYKKRDKKGYDISKLFSSNVTIKEMLDRFNSGLKNSTKLQRFYNGDLGKAFTAAGAKINETMLNDILGHHSNKSKHNINCGIIGIDVGSRLNIIIGDLLPSLKIKIVCIDEIPVDQEEIKKICREYNIKIGVMDALPEQHFVTKVKSMLPFMFSCYYQYTKSAPVDKLRNITVDRTSVLDDVQENILTNNLILPGNAQSIPDFYKQMTASTRVYEESKDGQKGRYNWVHSAPDHYHHALSYMLIARKLIVAMKK